MRLLTPKKRDTDAWASVSPARISQPCVLGGKKFERVLSFLVDGLTFTARGLQEKLWNSGMAHILGSPSRCSPEPRSWPSAVFNMAAGGPKCAALAPSVEWKRGAEGHRFLSTWNRERSEQCDWQRHSVQGRNQVSRIPSCLWCESCQCVFGGWLVLIFQFVSDLTQDQRGLPSLRF